MQALFIASTGMAAQEQNVNVISNNIANMRTTGYKRQRAEFQDLLYQEYRRAGSTTSDTGTQVPVGIEVGSGVRIAATPRVMSQGSVVASDKELDTAIQGEGYFMISLPDGRTAYTRDGSFERDSTGKLTTVDGYEVQPGITIPDNANSVTISPDGIVSAVIGTATTATQIGQLQLARFVNKGGLESIGNNMFTETGASGSAQVGVPNADGMGNIMQSYLEDANVNAVTEIADLIAAQRAYEMNARVVTGADEMLSTTSQMK
ncbi:MAG: flagellar basal-body rod protein FlgG [Devosia sp.]|nr:flagellar basal-body rod protein FlgG [Devosia sp.]